MLESIYMYFSVFYVIGSFEEKFNYRTNNISFEYGYEI